MAASVNFTKQLTPEFVPHLLSQELAVLKHNPVENFGATNERI